MYKKARSENQQRRRKAGNPNWGKPIDYTLPVIPTSFDEKVLALGLEPTISSYQSSRELRTWTRRWYRVKYVPEPLLEAWGLVLELD